MNLPIEAIEPPVQRQTETPIGSYLEVLIVHRWMILGMTLLAIALGCLYLLIKAPVYQSDIAVQVEEEAPNNQQTRSLMGDMASMFNIKSVTSGEMEVLRSRRVVEPTVNQFGLAIDAQPKYFPLIGRWFAKHADSFTLPDMLRFGGYAWGPERINIAKMEVPEYLTAKQMEITLTGRNTYSLRDPLDSKTFQGTVGRDEQFELPGGNIALNIASLQGPAGSKFEVRRLSQLTATEDLQSRMIIAERGRESGVIGVSLTGTNPELTAAILNGIGQEYVRQNVERKTAQAQKSLAFLDQQLPIMKKQLEDAETKYNSLRNSNSTIDLNEESKLILGQSVNTQTRLSQLRQQRSELITRFGPSHPSIVGIDSQIASLTSDDKRLNTRIRQMPDLEQNVVRLQRDVNVNTQLYTALLNNAQQMRLVEAGKIGNVRLIDTAAVAEKPIAPKPALVLAVAALVGLVLGLMLAFVRNALFGGLSDPDEVERFTGIPVLATIPFAEEQERLWRKLRRRNSTSTALLAQSNGSTPSIESLRGFRSVLQMAMRDAHNNVVVFTGPVPGVGKSFLSANFAFIQAAVGKRVLLIDADFRRGQLNKYYGTGAENGLFDVLAGTIALAEVRKRNISNGVDFISTGNVTFDPSELLASPAFADCLATLSSQYDMVIIDTAPVLASSDAAVVGAHASAVLIVTRSGMNSVGEIRETEKRLINAGAPVAGVVFNGLKLNDKRFGFRSKYGRYRYTSNDYYSTTPH